MGRYTTVPALLVLLFTAACSGADDGDGNPPTASAAVPSSTRSSSGADAAPSPPATPSAFDLPADAKVLVPVARGSGNADLPVFKPDTDVYTIYATCTGKGKGKMTIVDRNAPADDPSEIACNGPVTLGRVYTEITTQRLSVRIHGGTVNWTLAVVSGEHPV